MPEISRSADTFTDWFDRTLDEKLASLPSDDARRDLLAQQADNWSRRHKRFVVTQGNSEQPHPRYGKPTAYDFLHFINSIDMRLAALNERVPA